MYHIIINEAQGVSLGLKKIADELSDIITDLFFAYYPHSAYHFSYDNLKRHVHKKEYISGTRIVLETTIDPKWNDKDASVWLSNFTKIIIDICYYKTKRNTDSIRPLEGCHASYRKMSDKVRGIITVSVDSYDDINQEYDTPLVYLSPNVSIDPFDNKAFSSYIQHELQHLHVDKNMHNDRNNAQDVNYNKAYDRINTCIQMHGLTSKFAHAIYKYCIDTEFQAHLNQFYNQYNKVNLNSSDQYRKTKEDLEYFKNLEIPEYAYNAIYKNLYDAYMTLFPNLRKFKASEKVAFVNHLKKRIIYRINKMIYCIHKATTVNEQLSDWSKSIKLWGSGLVPSANRVDEIYNNLTERQQRLEDLRRMRLQNKDNFFELYE